MYRTPEGGKKKEHIANFLIRADGHAAVAESVALFHARHYACSLGIEKFVNGRNTRRLSSFIMERHVGNVHLQASNPSDA